MIIIVFLKEETKCYGLIHNNSMKLGILYVSATGQILKVAVEPHSGHTYPAPLQFLSELPHYFSCHVLMYRLCWDAAPESWSDPDDTNLCLT